MCIVDEVDEVDEVYEVYEEPFQIKTFSLNGRGVFSFISCGISERFKLLLGCLFRIFCLFVRYEHTIL